MTLIPENKPSSLPELENNKNLQEAVKEEVKKEEIQEENPATEINTLDMILTNHEQRILNLEAALLRIRGAI